MADAVCGLVLFYSLVFGARRGFYKEAVHALALVVAILLARSLRVPAGAWIAEHTGAPSLLAEIGAVVGVWVVAFFVTAVVGRLVLKKIRGKGVDDNLDDGAEALADAIAGDTTKGPLTLLTDPIATKTGLFYWSDKLLGAGLGFAKGVATVIVVFALLLYADRARGWESSFARSIESSYAAGAFRGGIEPYLQSFPEYRIVTSLGAMRGVAESVKEDPRRFVAFATHPELRGLRGHPKIVALAEDAEVRAAWEARDLKELLLCEEVRALLTDRELRQRIAEVDWAKVGADVEAHEPDIERDAQAMRELLLGGESAAPTEEAAVEGEPAAAEPSLPAGGVEVEVPEAPAMPAGPEGQ